MLLVDNYQTSRCSHWSHKGTKKQLYSTKPGNSLWRVSSVDFKPLVFILSFSAFENKIDPLEVSLWYCMRLNRRFFPPVPLLAEIQSASAAVCLILTYPLGLIDKIQLSLPAHLALTLDCYPCVVPVLIKWGLGAAVLFIIYPLLFCARVCFKYHHSRRGGKQPWVVSTIMSVLSPQSQG